MEKDTLFEKRMLELSKNAYYRGILTYSDFLDLHQLHRLQSLNAKEYGVTVKTYGGFALAERQMAVFIPDAFFFESDYPISCIHIRPVSAKYAEELTHRDYLGAIVNLGLERDKVGDILTSENEAWVFCHQQMSGFLMQELCRIRHTAVIAQEVTNKEDFPKLQTQAISGTVSSLRLDSLTALAFSVSRSSILPLIEGGKVFVNGKNIVSNGYTVKVGDIISVRGKGKFQFGKINGTTKKDRYHITIDRYR